ncbi:MAG: sialate O-acetylesterase [Cyclobacteriaceae bacterium]
MKRFLFSSTIILFSLTAFADVRLPKIFGDNMVLQRDHPIVIWGWSNPKEKITVLLNKQSKTVTAGKDGKWKLSLNPESAGGPYVFVVKGKNTVTLNNVLIGEVWVCSGQSNMEWTVRNSQGAEAEIPKGNFPTIRHIKIPNSMSAEPLTDIKESGWKTCDPQTVGDFTAVGYYFARELAQETNVPVGLINTSWGGTHIETWTSRDAFENSEEFRSMIASMPRLNLDSIAKKKTESTVKRIEALQGPLSKSKAIASEWKSAEFNDSSWPEMNVPGLWENQALGDFDGTVWLRKTFSVSEKNAGKEAVIHLAMIDDADETFLNGVLIGSGKNYNEKRIYTIPSGTLRSGKNVIAVMVNDTGGGGGIHGESADMKVSIANEAQSLAGVWVYQVESLVQNTSGVGPNSYPTLLYNAMINPLLPYTIRGALWYQGESNAGRAFEYRKAFPLMISDWRKKWGQGDFPFYFVQLATFNASGGNSKKGSTWAELREAQAMTLALPNTGMAVTTDIGNPLDIHPRNKRDVGKRLAALALSDIYGKDTISRGPTFQSLEKEGNKIILTFKNIGTGLSARDKYGYLKGFEIAGDDRQFYYARAHIEGDKIVVNHDSVNEPVAVRFGWSDDASDNNLFNEEGFPAPPFRTDEWEGITENSKFHIGQ